MSPTQQERLVPCLSCTSIISTDCSCKCILFLNNWFQKVFLNHHFYIQVLDTKIEVIIICRYVVVYHYWFLWPAAYLSIYSRAGIFIVCFLITWWRHQMETLFTLLAICAGNSPGTGEFSAERPVTRIFDVFFDLRLNKRLSKQSRRWWFETPSCSLWRHCNF